VPVSSISGNANADNANIDSDQWYQRFYQHLRNRMKGSEKWKKRIFNLPYRGIAFRGLSAGASQRNVSTLCRLQIGETAESNSALQGCPCPSSIGDAPLP